MLVTKGKIEITCGYCGTVFIEYACNKRTYCSQICSYVGRQGKGKSLGESRGRLYNIWSDMKSRCKGTSGKRNKEYYKNRGITVCEEWNSSYITFRTWALSNGYKKNLELDRKDNDKGYSPENCRWATRKQQTYNTRKRKNSLSKYRGVAYIKTTGRWRATGVKDGVIKHLGVFADEKDAAKAYDKWATIAFGEYASLNFTKRERRLPS